MNIIEVLVPLFAFIILYPVFREIYSFFGFEKTIEGLTKAEDPRGTTTEERKDPNFLIDYYMRNGVVMSGGDKDYIRERYKIKKETGVSAGYGATALDVKNKRRIFATLTEEDLKYNPRIKEGLTKPPLDGTYRYYEFDAKLGPSGKYGVEGAVERMKKQTRDKRVEDGLPREPPVVAAEPPVVAGAAAVSSESASIKKKKNKWGNWGKWGSAATPDAPAAPATPAASATQDKSIIEDTTKAKLMSDNNQTRIDELETNFAEFGQKNEARFATIETMMEATASQNKGQEDIKDNIDILKSQVETNKIDLADMKQTVDGAPTVNYVNSKVGSIGAQMEELQRNYKKRRKKYQSFRN